MGQRFLQAFWVHGANPRSMVPGYHTGGKQSWPGLMTSFLLSSFLLQGIRVQMQSRGETRETILTPVITLGVTPAVM